MNVTFRKFLYLIGFIITSPLAFPAWVEKRLFSGEMIFTFSGQLLSLIPGRIGSVLRLCFYKVCLEHVCMDSIVGFGSYFSHHQAKIGSHVCIGAYCVVGCAYIDDNAQIASRVSITSGKRQHIDDKKKITGRLNLSIVQIGKNSWIGEGAIVMMNVGDDCIIGAGTVVTKEIPSNAIAFGNPAIIKDKNTEH
jgi:acetyltransferase-like isoleucine patch superfamily enzyme